MPFALLAMGLLLVITAYNNTQAILSAQLKKDISGTTGFIYWIAAIVIVGAIGYIKPLETVSRVFLALILVILLLTNQGLFAKFNAAIAGDGGSKGNDEIANNPPNESKEGDKPPEINNPFDNPLNNGTQFPFVLQ